MMYKFVISGADTLVAKNSPLFWEMTECGLLYRYRDLGVACCLHFQDNQRRRTDFLFGGIYASIFRAAKEQTTL
jgi:hypothetical protein